MAGKPNKRSNRRKRPPPRVRLRQFNRALTLSPRKCVTPPDPPQRTLSLQQSAVLRINITFSQSTPLVPGGRLKPSTWNITGTKKAGLRNEDIAKLILKYGPYEASAAFEFSIRKVCYWGPIPSANTDESSPQLIVDLGGMTAGTAVSDRQAPNHRAHCGITIPFYLWAVSNTDFVIALTPHSSSGTAVLDISVVWRMVEKVD